MSRVYSSKAFEQASKNGMGILGCLNFRKCRGSLRECRSSKSTNMLNLLKSYG